MNTDGFFPQLQDKDSLVTWFNEMKPETAEVGDNDRGKAGIGEPDRKADAKEVTTV